MKRFIALGVAAIATLAFVAAATSAPPTTHGPYSLTTPDGGCAGNTWANDTVSRTYEVKKAQDVAGQPAWRVTRIDRGTFVTLNGTSPGNCAANTSPHGTHVNANKTGKIHGRLMGVVTGGTYNPAGSCANPCTTTAFISGFFGSAPTVHFSCLDGYANCSFEFNYHATIQGLTFTNWTDKDNGGTGEIFIGDIANS